MNRYINTVIIFLLATFIVNANNFVFTPINVSNGLSDNQIRYILQLSDGRMVFTTSGNLNIYDGSNFKYIHRTTQHIYPLRKYDGFYRVYQYGDSILWIKDTHKLMGVDLRQERYIKDLSAYFKNKGISQPIDDLFMDSVGRLWILNSGKLWNTETSEVFDISLNVGDLQDLTTDENNIYLFYNTGKIICYDLKTKIKRYIEAAYTENEQPLYKNTSLVVTGNRGFYQLRNGIKGGFFFFNTQEAAWKKILETDYALNTLVIKDQIVYISCATGIWIINCQSGEKEYLPVLKTIEGNNIDTDISTLFFDKQNGFWLGTVNQGLLYYHTARYKFNYIGRSYFPFASTKDIIVQSFDEDEVGNIYVKCNSGIYRYFPSGKDNPVLIPVSFQFLSKDISNRLNKNIHQTFNGETYTSVHTDSRGWTWAGTSDGLMLFKPEEPQKQIFYTEDGLSNNFVHAILEDRNHNIWITTSNGISKVQIDSANGKVLFTNFNTYDGTLSGEYSNGAIFESREGTLFFGGINGFNILYPNHIPVRELPLKPLFTSLILSGVKVEVGIEYDGRVILPHSAPYTKKIELSYKQNFLTLDYSAVNYLNPSQTLYRYKLEGVDVDWHETYPGGQQTGTNGILRVSYTNLPYGKYLFKVMASANGQQWDGSVTELKIIIHAPWWKTTTAYILYILSFIIVTSLSVWLYIYFSCKKLERQHKEEILLLRIRNLIEQNKLLEEEKGSYNSKEDTEESIRESNNNISTADAEFLTRAIEIVEMNINEPTYTVETLSRDLCMDRTGLYRKLIAILDKSPSLFIRNIRLQKAAQLILDGKLTIAEITEKVGFSSSSYLSKCFQEMYGCRPTEYADKVKKST